MGLQPTILRVRALFDAVGASPETPSVDENVDVFVRLIETSVGERTFRTVSQSMQALLEAYNARGGVAAVGHHHVAGAGIDRAAVGD
jgi:hypothetical protein